MGPHYTLILCIGLLALVLAGTAEGATLVVDDDGGDWADHITIQSAVDSAGVGDIIDIYNGTYEEAVTINKTVDILGNGSTEVFIGLPVGSSGDVVTITGVNATLNGVTVSDGGPGAGHAGIQIEDTEGVEVISCEVTGNGMHGIYVLRSEEVILTGNFIHSNGGYGIQLESSTDAVLNNNDLRNESIFILGAEEAHFGTHDFSANKVNSRTVYYRSKANGLTVPSTAGEVILVNCTDMVVRDLVERNLTLLIAYSKNITVSNCSLSGNIHGPYIWDSDRITITESWISNNSVTGAYIAEGSKRILFEDCVFSNNPYGVYAASSIKVDVIDSKLNDNNVGFLLSGSTSSVMVNCELLRNSVSGISLLAGSNENEFSEILIRSSWSAVEIDSSHDNLFKNSTMSSSLVGVYMSDSSRNTIEKCIIRNSTGKGIEIDGGDNNTVISSTIEASSSAGLKVGGNYQRVTKCHVEDNSIGISLVGARNTSVDRNNVLNNNGYGITLDAISGNCVVTRNNVSGNGGGTSQAFDDATPGNNTWNDTGRGNWWSDYTGDDLNGDGIGDTPYSIAGYANAKDLQPFKQTGPFLVFDLVIENDKTLEGNTFLIYARVDSAFDVDRVAISFFIDGVIVKQVDETVGPGITIFEYNWTAVAGTHDIRVKMTQPQVDEQTDSVSVVSKADRDSGEEDPGFNWGLAIGLLIGLFILVNFIKMMIMKKIKKDQAVKDAYHKELHRKGGHI